MFATCCSSLRSQKMVNFAHIKAGNRLTARYCWKEKKIHLPAPEAHLPAPDPVCCCWTVSKAGAGTLWSLVLLCQENKWRDQEVNGRARTNRNLVEPQLFIQLRVHSLLRVHPPGTSVVSISSPRSRQGSKESVFPIKSWTHADHASCVLLRCCMFWFCSWAKSRFDGNILEVCAKSRRELFFMRANTHKYKRLRALISCVCNKMTYLLILLPKYYKCAAWVWAESIKSSSSLMFFPLMTRWISCTAAHYYN